MPQQESIAGSACSPSKAAAVSPVVLREQGYCGVKQQTVAFGACAVPPHAVLLLGALFERLAPES
jgi:hypothetical protein